MTGNVAHSAAVFVDNPTATEVFATDISGFVRLGANISMTFETWVADHHNPSAPFRRVVVGRLVMPNEAAQRLAIGLHGYLSQQGLDPTTMLKGEAPVQ